MIEILKNVPIPEKRQRGVTERAAIKAEAERLGQPELVEQAFEELS